MIDFDFKHFEELSNQKNLEEVIRDFDWKAFEKIVSNIFEKNDFKIKTNFRFKTSRRFEIDVLAISDLYVICVDCKEWGKGRDKTSGLKKAVEMQEERVDELKRFFNHNPVASRMMRIGKQEFFSLIVTWHEEELIMESKTLVVPVWKLNAFIGNIENYY
ncbi:MAG: NERD domain-containing protein [Candidatus Aenigmatarchaeota archaeon]